MTNSEIEERRLCRQAGDFADHLNECAGREKEHGIIECEPHIMRPCPFCGGSASTMQMSDKDGNLQNDWFISCDTCLAGFMEPTDTEQESIEKWNTRA